MKWIVLEENPKQDFYISIIAASEDRALKLERKACSVFQTSDGAYIRAKQLCDLFKVKSILTFYVD